ncbi:universal stress protein [Rhodococcus opacus]|uniref:universal stress protein n=1 Tax=Rhodococcus opacus TaxID=37919 RepID=UPI0007CD627A|nr:universal stress protein [Rhodococcus opacus]
MAIAVVHRDSPEGRAAIVHAAREAVQRREQLRLHEHDGDQVSALRALVDSSGADLLVVGTRRMSPIGKFLLERWLQRLLLEVDIPILVVKEDVRGTA